MTEADLLRCRSRIVEEWIAATGTPYRWGCKQRGIGLDCSGLIECGWRAAGVWPFDGDASADRLWRVCTKVEWSERQPGDAICYGEGGRAHHIVGIVRLPDRTYEGQIIGANHGRAPIEGETATAYARRMDAIPARVEIAGDSYWINRRLGVIRAPRLQTT